MFYSAVMSQTLTQIILQKTTKITFGRSLGPGKIYSSNSQKGHCYTVHTNYISVFFVTAYNAQFCANCLNQESTYRSGLAMMPAHRALASVRRLRAPLNALIYSDTSSACTKTLMACCRTSASFISTALTAMAYRSCSSEISSCRNSS